jgi:hypothetical protein
VFAASFSFMSPTADRGDLGERIARCPRGTEICSAG